MRTALVVAHPNPEAFTHHLAERAHSGLEVAGHDVTTIDLAADGFRAAMTPDERRAYHSETPIVDPQIARYAQIVTGVDALVFVYPTWWGGLPAILKGFLDRVMVPGVGFRFDERTGKVKPGLTNVRRIVGVSTYGSPRWYVAAMTDNGRRSLTRNLRLSCGIRARTTWVGLYGIDTTTATERLDFAARVEREMAALR